MRCCAAATLTAAGERLSSTPAGPAATPPPSPALPHPLPPSLPSPGLSFFGSASSLRTPPNSDPTSPFPRGPTLPVGRPWSARGPGRLHGLASSPISLLPSLQIHRRPSGPPVSLRFHWRPRAFPGLPRALAHLCACVLRPASLCASPLSTGIRALCQFLALGEMNLCADCSRLQRGLKKCSLHADCSDDPLRWAHPSTPRVRFKMYTRKPYGTVAR
jgi:hypothetical protein